MAGSTVAGLHFVEDQQRPVPVTQLADSVQKFRCGADHTAFAQHRFQNHRTGPVGNGLGKSGQIVERDMSDTGR